MSIDSHAQTDRKNKHQIKPPSANVKPAAAETSLPELNPVFNNVNSVESQAGVINRLSTPQAQESVAKMNRVQGHRHVQRVMAHVNHTPNLQTQLTIGAEGDAFEQEADAVSESLMKKQASDFPSPPSITPGDNGAVAGPSLQRSRLSSDVALHTASSASRVQTALSIQPKLTVGAADDFFEQEADQVSDTVMKMPAPASPPSDGERGDGQGDDVPIQRPSVLNRYVQTQRLQASSEGAFQADAAVESRIETMRGGGRPLPESERNFFEQRMGVDLSSVRVHTGGDAVQTSKDLNARAYTVGSDVAFNSGEYQPGTSEGRRLLGHELTHVVQQGAAGALQRKSPAQPAHRSDRSGGSAAGSRSLQREVTQEQITAYREDVKSSSAWGTTAEAQTLAEQLGIGFNIYRPDKDGRLELVAVANDPGPNDTRHLLLVGDGHYEVIVRLPVDTQEDSDYVGLDKAKYRQSKLKPRSDGSCMYDAIHIVKEKRRGKDDEINTYRRMASENLSKKAIEAEIKDLQGDKLSGRMLLGLGPQMREKLGLDEDNTKNIKSKGSGLSLKDIKSILSAIKGDKTLKDEIVMLEELQQSLEDLQGSCAHLIEICHKQFVTHIEAAGSEKKQQKRQDKFQESLDILNKWKAKLPTYNDEFLTKLYHYLQSRNVSSDRHIISAWTGMDGYEDIEAQEVLMGDVDYRVSRVVGLLYDEGNIKWDKESGKLAVSGKLKSSAGRFKALMKFLAGGDAEKLANRYELLVGKSLLSDLEAAYKDKPLRYQYLKQILEQGKPAPSARLALKLGLLSGTTPFNVRDKGRVSELIHSNPKAFGGLLGKGKGPEDDFIVAARKKLTGTGILGELGGLLKIERSKDEKDPQKASAAHADYLMSLIINPYDPIITYYCEGVGPVEMPKFRHSTRFTGRVKELQDRLVNWGTKIATETEQKAFIASAINVMGKKAKVAMPADLSGGQPKAYVEFWKYVHQWGLLASDKINFALQTIENQYLSKVSNQDKRGALGEMDTTLEQHSQKWRLTKRKKNTGIKHLVMQYLSVPETGDFDPQLALIERYGSKPKDDMVVTDVDPRRDLETKLQDAFSKFRSKLKSAGLKERQIEQIREFVFLRGAEGEGSASFNQLGIYQKLKKLQRSNKRFHKGEIKGLLEQLEPNSMQYHMIRGDEALLSYIEKKASQKIWYAIKRVLRLPEKKALYPSRPSGKTKDFHTQEDVGEYRELQDQIEQDERYPGQDSNKYYYWAGKLYLNYRKHKDGNRALEVAYQAQEAGIDGQELGNTIVHYFHFNFDSKFNYWAKSSHKRTTFRGETSAFESLRDFLMKGTRIQLTDLLHATRAITRFGVDSEGIDFALEQITKENVLDYIDETTYNNLKQKTDERFSKRLERYQALKEDKSPKEQQKLQSEIEQLTQDVQTLELRIDQDLLKKFKAVKTRSGYAEIKRHIYTLLGKHLQDGESQRSKQLKMSSGEKNLKGQQTRGKAGILNQRYLEDGFAFSTKSTGLQWDHRSTAGMETSESVSGFLDTIQKNQLELGKLHSKESLNKDEQAQEKLLLKDIKTAEDSMEKYQKIFKDTQDRLKAQTEKIIMTIVAMLIMAATLSTGVAASAAVFQLAWAISTSLLVSSIKLWSNLILSRTSDLDQGSLKATMAAMGKDVLVQLANDLWGFAIVSELTLAVDLMGMGAHTGNWAQQLFGKPGLGLLKAQIQSIVGNAPEAVVNQLFKKHPISGLKNDISNAFKSKIKSLPEELLVGFAKGVVVEGFRQGQAKLLGDLKWAPSGSPIANKYATKDENGTWDLSQTETAKSQLFGGGGGFKDFGIFVGGPSTALGADVSIWEGNDFKASYLAHAIKTTVYEEFIDRAKGKLGGALKGVYQGAIGQQSGVGYKPSHSTDEDPESENEPAVPLKVTVDHLRFLGLQLSDSDDPQKIAEELRAQVEKEDQSHVVEMFQTFLSEAQLELKQKLEVDKESLLKQRSLIDKQQKRLVKKQKSAKKSMKRKRTRVDQQTQTRETKTLEKLKLEEQQVQQGKLKLEAETQKQELEDQKGRVEQRLLRRQRKLAEKKESKDRRVRRFARKSREKLELEDQRQEKQTRVSQQQEQFDGKRLALEGKRAEQQELAKRKVVAEQRVQDLDKQFDGQEESSEKDEQALTEQRNLKKQKAEAEQQVQGFAEQLVLLDKKINALEEEVRKHEEVIKGLNGEIAPLEEKIEGLTEQLTTLERGIEERTEQIKTLESEIKDYEATIKDLDGKIALLVEQIETLENEIATLADKQKTLAVEIEDLGVTMGDLGKELEEFKSKEQQLAKEIGELEKNKLGFGAAIESLDQEIVKNTPSKQSGSSKLKGTSSSEKGEKEKQRELKIHEEKEVPQKTDSNKTRNSQPQLHDVEDPQAGVYDILTRGLQAQGRQVAEGVIVEENGQGEPETKNTSKQKESKPSQSEGTTRSQLMEDGYLQMREDFEVWLENHGIRSVPNNGNGHNNCLVISLLQHATGNYESAHEEAALQYKNQLEKLGVTENEPLHSDTPTFVTLLETINRDYRKDLKIVYAYAKGGEVPPYFLMTVSSTGSTPVVIWDKVGHYEALKKV